MRVIAFIERCQRDVVEKILCDGGLWEGPNGTDRSSLAAPLPAHGAYGDP